MNRIFPPLIFLILVACPAFLTGQTSYPANSHATPLYTYTVVHAFPHDTSAFTQGLAYHDGFLYEGTGRSGQSSLRKVRLETGEVLRRVNLAPEFFGEGIAILNDKVFQLTWTSGVAFEYNLSDFHRLRKFSFSGEGWGLASNGRELFLSDGSSEIRVLDPETFHMTQRIKVHDGSVVVDQLNELEFVDGQLFANVWHTNRIARISPQTGEVLGWIDLTGLLSSVYRLDSEAVLNGIAYDPSGKRLFVTGKLWPSVFEIRLAVKGRK